jgi:hypothetical protein
MKQKSDPCTATKTEVPITMRGNIPEVFETMRYTRASMEHFVRVEPAVKRIWVEIIIFEHRIILDKGTSQT